MLLSMTTLKRIIVSLFVASLAACGVAAPVPTITLTTMPSPTPDIPTAPLALPTPSVTSTATSSLPVSSAPDGLRMAYVIDGNLYFQGGSNPPVQLTKSGDDRYPVFSDDGEKIIFRRGLLPYGLYSINIDGTQELALITGDLLDNLGSGYDEYTEIVAFGVVPGTHQVLFNTRQLSPTDIEHMDMNRPGAQENYDLLSVDADTGKIRSLLPQGKGGNFAVSPDGNRVAIQANGHIDVVSIDGQIVIPNLVAYTPTHPYDLRPRIFWKADSTELIITLPVREIADLSGPESLLVGRYPLDGSNSMQVAFDPPVLDGDYDVSPDGNWILYFYFYYPGKTDETIPTGIYLSNLQTGESKLHSTGIGPPIWGPDSRHFVFDYLFLGVVDGPQIFLNATNFLGWVDAEHYLCVSNGMIGIGDVNGEIELFDVDIPQTSVSPRYSGLFTFHFQDR
jgi:Tol biopolymer transport system component